MPPDTAAEFTLSLDFIYRGGLMTSVGLVAVRLRSDRNREIRSHKRRRETFTSPRNMPAKSCQNRLSFTRFDRNSYAEQSVDLVEDLLVWNDIFSKNYSL